MTILTALGRESSASRNPMAAYSATVTSNRLLVLAVFVAAIMSPSGWPQTRISTFQTVNDVDTVTFDPAKLSEAKLHDLILLSPFLVDYINDMSNKNFSAAGSTVEGVPDKYLIALPLELCLAGDPDYSNCQENEIAGPNFLRNAQVNLQKSKRGLVWLQGLQHPKELDPVITFLTEGLSHSIWMEETRLKYYSTWDDTVLKQTPEGVNFEQLCPDVFRKLETAGSIAGKYAIARFDWPNCLAKSPGKKRQRYPIEAWKQFLDSYGIA